MQADVIFIEVFEFVKTEAETLELGFIFSCLSVGKSPLSLLTDVTFLFSNHRHIFLALLS